jgi:hypothetical protein
MPSCLPRRRARRRQSRARSTNRARTGSSNTSCSATDATSSHKRVAHRLVRGWHAAQGEFDLSIGELLPALDDGAVAALRNATENVADGETRRLQRQRVCLTNEVVVFGVTKVAAVGEISLLFHEALPVFLTCQPVSGPAQLRYRCASEFPIRMEPFQNI